MTLSKNRENFAVPIELNSGWDFMHRHSILLEKTLLHVSLDNFGFIEFFHYNANLFPVWLKGKTLHIQLKYNFKKKFKYTISKNADQRRGNPLNFFGETVKT